MAIWNLQRELFCSVYSHRRKADHSRRSFDLAPQFAGAGFYSNDIPTNTATFRDFQRYVRERTRATCEKEEIPLPVYSDDEDHPGFKTTAAILSFDEDGTPLLPEDLDLDNIKSGQVKLLQSTVREFMKAHISKWLRTINSG